MNEQLCTIALSLIKGLSLVNVKEIYERVNSAMELFEYHKDIRQLIPDASPQMVEAIASLDFYLPQAEREIEFAQNKKIKILCLNDESYPYRLRDCIDAPIVLYTMGNTNFNVHHVVSIVGTRKCTEYGRDICKYFISDLKRYFPDILIVSGLAYGIDINSHRAALANGMNTVGVLAHGFGRHIYPQIHRQTAIEMLLHGGLLTEFTNGVSPERYNFVQRNRIIAGLSDATIVVESANRGGSLITADIASSYNRDVFAFPGRIYDQCSEGCNRLLKEQRAVAIQNAEDFITSMCWDIESGLINRDSSTNKSNQLELFEVLSDNEKKIIKTLTGVDDKMINQIVIETGLNFNIISSTLFDLEMKGLVKVLGGARYKICPL